MSVQLKPSLDYDQKWLGDRLFAPRNFFAPE